MTPDEGRPFGATPPPSPEDDGDLEALITSVPEGWSRTTVGGRSWGVTRTSRAHGKVMSFLAERLDTGEALGANVWLTSHGALLRPCEVPAESVMNFLRDAAARFDTSSE